VHSDVITSHSVRRAQPSSAAVADMSTRAVNSCTCNSLPLKGLAGENNNKQHHHLSCGPPSAATSNDTRQQNAVQTQAVGVAQRSLMKTPKLAAV
jgi:hypothetical protein